MRLFETFWIAPKGPHFICFDILQHNGCQKIPNGPPFHIFRHCDTVQKSQKKFFLGNFFMSSKGPLQFFFHFLQPAGVSQSPKGPPFSILSLRYGADFGRSRLASFFFNAHELTKIVLKSSTQFYGPKLTHLAYRTEPKKFFLFFRVTYHTGRD